MPRASLAAEFVVLENAGHGFAKPEDEQAWYDALVAFLARHNPADAGVSADAAGAAQSPPPSLTSSS